MTTISFRTNLAKPLLWCTFLVFLVIAGYTTLYHEMWGDEVHSWNIAKGSTGFFDLISNIRYEGHPPLWHTTLWAISKFTHSLQYVQLAHLVIASLVVFLVLFASPFPLITRILIPFGYFFLYEYTVLSRNYAIGVLLAFCICLIIRKDFRYKLVLYYGLLFLLSNVHILGIILAGSLHLYFLMMSAEQRQKRKFIIAHFLLAVLIVLPGMYLSFPPSDGALFLSFFIDRWEFKQIVITAQSPLRAFVPIPAWWNHNSWNTEFLLEIQKDTRVLRFVTPVIALSMAGLMGFLLRKSKKCLALFGVNILLTFIFSATLFALITIRYTGFIYIGFLVSWWLYCYEMPADKISNRIIHLLLVIQIIAGVYSVVQDIRYPFSNFNKVGELLKKVPAQEKVGTDYWALNAASAFTDSGLYCIDVQKHLSFILWGSDYKLMSKIPNRYYTGVKKLFQQEGIRSVYMISSGSPENLFKFDPKLRDSFQVKLFDKREGAIEKGGNLYLYHIQSK